MDAPGSAPTDGIASEPAQQDLIAACRAVLVPLARLAVARGLPYAQIADLLKTALVQAARAAHGDAGARRAVSRISAATGLTRRDVTRRVANVDETPPPRRSPATELFTRWLSDPQLRGKKRFTRKLPRQGEWPSFETLAQSVTRDVHPRTLLDEICRLGLARFDERSDTVELVRDTFVPQDDQRRLLGFLSANVGDHLAAAVSNVLSSSSPRHLEQALFADELSMPSLEQARPLIAAQWQTLVQRLAPELREMIEEDRAAGRTQDQRLRVGIYAYTAQMASRAAESAGEGDADVRT